MIKKKIQFISVLFLFSIFFLTCCSSKPDKMKYSKTADFILKNGIVITIDKKMKIAESVAIKDNKIIFCGSNIRALRYNGDKTKIFDMTGKTIIPGLHDAHLHFKSGAESITKNLSLRFLNMEQIQKKIKEAIDSSPPHAVIRAFRFNQVYFKNKKWPTRYDLDKISPDNPVIISRVDGHTLWVNSKVLSMCDISKNTKDPYGGEIQRFKDGTPTGILKENAEDLVKDIKGPKMVLPGEPQKSPIESAIVYANQLGLTSVTTSGDLNLIKKLNDLRKKGKLYLRFNVWLPIKKTKQYLKKGIKFNDGNDFVKVSFLKIYSDGTIGSSTAAMFDPYIHNHKSRGILIHPINKLNQFIENAHKNNWQVGIHAIGNRAAYLTLNAIEKAQKKYGIKNLRHRIEHSQFVRDSDLFRYKKLGVIPSMQPTHCTTDLLVVEDRIGKEYAKQGYRWNSFVKTGSILAFGTDWPIEPLDPRRGLYSAIERKNIENGQNKEEWFPEEDISIIEAIKSYTFGSAYASFNEHRIGSIEKGKLADLTVFDGNLLEIAKSNQRKILSIQIYMTIVNGKIVYKK